MKKKQLLLALALAAGFVLVACGSGSATGDPAKNIEAYLQARVKSDLNQMIGLSCAAWEPTAKVEATSFQAMNAKLDGVACQASETQGGTSFVACKGKIVTSYNGNNREWDLAERQFKSIQEGGEWRMCGYR
jgi:hypothetical protein